MKLWKTINKFSKGENGLWKTEMVADYDHKELSETVLIQNTT
jgi:hypothetical protein